MGPLPCDSSEGTNPSLDYPGSDDNKPSPKPSPSPSPSPPLAAAPAKPAGPRSEAVAAVVLVCLIALFVLLFVGIWWWRKHRQGALGPLWQTSGGLPKKEDDYLIDHKKEASDFVPQGTYSREIGLSAVRTAP